MSARPDDVSPQEREARIAELRTRRRARMRTLAVRSVLGMATLLLLAAVLVYWLLQTVAGRDMLLAQIIARLPTGSTLTWKSVEGPLSGPLTLRGVDFRYDQIHFTADRVYLDPDLRPLLRRRLQLDALEIDNATLDLPKDDEPFELPRWPDVLPDIKMPLAIQADKLVIDGLRVTSAREPLINVTRATGAIDIGNGYVHADRLAISSDLADFTLHGGYAPRDNFRTDLVATAVFPAPLGRTPARLGLAAHGDRAQMSAAVSGNAPAPVRATLTVVGETAPTWHFVGKTEGLDLALFGAAEDSTPLSFDLKADGKRGTMDVQGWVVYAEQKVVIDPSHLQIAGDVLTVDPLAIHALDGSATLRGRADFSDRENPDFDFHASVRDFTWGEDAANVIGADADFDFAGRLKAWTANGTATLTRAGETAKVVFDGRGNDQQVTLRRLQATMPSGTLNATGTVGWAPTLNWDLAATLAGFDPGYFAAGWDGNVSGRFTTRGTALAAPQSGFNASLNVPQLRGTLRGRPLDARGDFTLRGQQGQGDLALSLGDSRVTARGSVGTQLDINAAFSPLRLNDLLPGGAGSLEGTLKLTGARNAPNIDADLSGNGLKWNDWSAGTLSVRGRLPWQGRNGALAVQGTDINVGTVLDSLQLDARGSLQNLEVEGNAHNSLGAITLSGSAQQRNNNWQGSLDTLKLSVARGTDWTLQQPARFAQQGSNWTLSQTCLAANGGGSLCANANWPNKGINVSGEALPLTLLQPWLPRVDNREMILRGNIDLDGNVRPQGNQWAGNLDVTSSEGGLKLGAAGRRELASYKALTLSINFNPQRLQASLGSDLSGDGRIDAKVTTGWDAYAPLSGELRASTSQIFWLELFSPDLVRPQGNLDANITLAGTRAEPILGGQASLTDFKGEMPAMGITLTDGSARLIAQPDGNARIEATVRSGEGAINVQGSLGWRDTTSPLLLTVTGENFLISDTRELRAVANPDLQVGFDRTTGVLTLNGKVTVPSAKLDLERLDQGISPSPDVVVLDPVDPERDSRGTPLDMDLTLVLGDDVRMDGFGLEGSLTGELRVRGRPGREMTGQGGLDVDGRYEAYGQKLDITGGQLRWSNSPISDPRINIRAQRVVGEVTAGIHVTGLASQPHAEVWSDPVMQDSEALSYLVLGRSLARATSRESQQINVASEALSAGAGLLGSQLGAVLGLDNAGVMQSRALGGSVFGVGKFLSPRLYVGYGVSMVGSGQVITLKYLLRRGFDIEIESSTVENRASLNYRREK